MKATKTLFTYYLREALQTRLFLVLLACWAVLIIGGLTLNSIRYKQQRDHWQAEVAAANDFFGEVRNARMLFNFFLTKRRPLTASSALVGGTEHLAPGHIDFRPRLTSSYYHGGDVDPLARVLQPFDLTTMVGLVGFLLALLLGHEAVNGEVERKNAYVLLVHGVSLRQVLVAKTLALFVLIGGTFLLVFAVGIGIHVYLVPEYAAQNPLSLVLLGLTCLGYLLFSVVAATMLSAIVRRRGSAFVVGAGAFLLMVYVIPFLVQFIGKEVAPLGWRPGELIEAKVIESRVLHRKTDPLGVAIQVYGATHERPESVAALAPFPAFKEYPEMMSFMLAGANRFIDDNADLAMALDQQYHADLHRQSEQLLEVAVPLSPYMALAHGLSVLADTSVFHERQLVEQTATEYFESYRDWFRRLMAWDLQAVPLEKFPWAPSMQPLSFGAVGWIDYPHWSIDQKLDKLRFPWTVIVLATVGCFLVGLWGVRRFRLK